MTELIWVRGLNKLTRQMPVEGPVVSAHAFEMLASFISRQTVSRTYRSLIGFRVFAITVVLVASKWRDANRFKTMP